MTEPQLMLTRQRHEMAIGRRSRTEEMPPACSQSAKQRLAFYKRYGIYDRGHQTGLTIKRQTIRVCDGMCIRVPEFPLEGCKALGVHSEQESA